MMRWITRLAAIGLAAALIGFLWSRANSDFEDEDFDEEIPIEFDVPLETASAGGAPSAVNDGDTGEGPGANLDGAASDAGAAPAEATTDTESDHDDLTLIRGIGPAFQKRLNDAGIMTFKQLADADPGSLEEGGIEGVGVDLQSWIEQARALATGSAG